MIRSASVRDVSAMVDVYNQAIEDQVFANCDILQGNCDAFESLYFTNNNRYLVLVNESDTNGNISGWAAVKKFSARPYDDSIAEVAVYIRRENRSAGTGIRLLRELIKHAKNAEFQSLVAVILGRNIQSLRGSVACGFEEKVRMRAIASVYGQEEDIVWMQRMLT
jgi:phosphinothricin acetyltransferase